MQLLHTQYTSRYLCAAIIVYCAIFIMLGIIKLDAHDYTAIDLGIYTQVAWHTAHGDPFGMTIHPHSYLGDHFEPLLAFLAIPFFFFQSPLTLLIFQTLAIGLTAWPLFRIGKRYIGDMPALGIAALFLLNPFVQNANAFEFHMLPFAMFGIAWTYVWFLEKKFWAFTVTITAALLVREDVSLVVMMFSAIAFFYHRERRWKLTPLILASIWLIGSLLLIAHFNPDGGYKFFTYYSPLTSSNADGGVIASFASNVLLKLIHPYTWVLAMAFLLPFMGIPLLGARMLLPSVLVFIQVALTGFTELVLKTHYSALMLPSLFVALVFGLQRLRERPPRILAALPMRMQLITILLATVTLYSVLTFGPLPSLGAAVFFSKSTNNAADQMLAAYVAEVQKDDSVIASFAVLPHLAARSDLYSLHYAFLGTRQYSKEAFPFPQDIDRGIVDFNDFLIYHLQSFGIAPYADAAVTGPKRIRDFFRERGLVPTKVFDTLALYERSLEPGIELYRAHDTPPTDLSGKIQSISPELTFVGWKELPIDNDKLFGRSVFWRVESPIDVNYQLLLTSGNYQKYYPLGYGLYPIWEWPVGKIIQINYWWYIPNTAKTSPVNIQLVDIEGYVQLDGLRSPAMNITRSTLIGSVIAVEQIIDSTQ